MKNLMNSVVIAACLIASSASIAEIKIPAKHTGVQMHPMQAYTLDLSDHTAVVYYVVQENGDYQIVTTIGPNAGVTGNASQHRVVMSKDQSWSFSPDNGESSSVISFTSNDGALLVHNH